MDYDIQPSRTSNQTRKKRKSDHSSLLDMEMTASDVVGPNVTSNKIVEANCQIVENEMSRCVNGSKQHDEMNKILDAAKISKEMEAIPQSIDGLKENIANIASMLNLQVVPVDGDDIYNINTSFAVDIKAIKKQFLENMDKDKIRKLKKLLKMKNGKRKKNELRSLILDSGLSEDLLRLLAQETSHSRRKFCMKDDLTKSYKKSVRLRTQERQQKLLELAENLKRSKGHNAGTVVSRVGNKKISLHKSSVCIFSHQTHFLNQDNIEEAVEVLSSRMNKYGRLCDKGKEKKAISTPKRQRKMRQLVGRITKDINEAGYRVTFSNTIGSDIESLSAELSVVPIRVDELYSEIRDDPKLEISEEDYAKNLEREHFIEKQKANEEKMKELEVQLTQILSGVEEIITNKRKRYGIGSTNPTDAERMKMFRRKLKEDPEKYHEYKQKRSLTIKKRRLNMLASKMKESVTAAGITASDVNEKSHNAPNLSLPQTGAPVTIHCPQVYVHPSTHQPPAPAVTMHHAGQYVTQVPGMQTGHQHQQGLPYTGEMDIVELIAATHNVQNQHFA